MYQLIYFIQKYKYFLFFVCLELIALAFIINNHQFHKSKFISSANAITGGLYEETSRLTDYFHLKEQNSYLVDENHQLKNQLEKLLSKKESTPIFTVDDSLQYHQKYTYIPAKIIKNNFSTPYNFLTINKGKEQGVYKEMAVINNKGIVGITDAASKNYSRVLSILNKNSKINARLKKSFHFGTLIWDGKDYNIVQLIDVPRQAVVKKGDTIITGGKSTIFPEGILIGTVINSRKDKENSINIRLFNDMSNLGYVYVVTSLDKKELRNLENNNNE